MRDRIPVGMRELRLDGGGVGVELEEPRRLAVGAGSALDEAELLVEVRAAARDEALGLEIVKQIRARLLVERIADEHAAGDAGDAVGEGARRRALILDLDCERGAERAPKVSDVLGRMLVGPSRTGSCRRGWSSRYGS